MSHSEAQDARADAAPDQVQVELPTARLSYRTWGRGPAVLLLHGLAGSGEAWVPVAEQLARRHTVVVPDLLDHGLSVSRNGDHSLAGSATAMRDLLAVLGHERAAVVGHSLGGGVALHLAYQHPPYCERLLLVSPGGFGREVHPALRAMSLPGSEMVLAVWGLASRLRRHLRRDPQAAGASPRLDHPFLSALRTVVDWKGQRVDALGALMGLRPSPTRRCSRQLGVGATGDGLGQSPQNLAARAPAERTTEVRW